MDSKVVGLYFLPVRLNCCVRNKLFSCNRRNLKKKQITMNLY